MKTSKANHQKKKALDSTVYKRMLEIIRDPFMVNQDGQTKYVNSKTLELLGYDNEAEIIGQKFDLIVHPEDYPQVLSNHQRRLRGEQLENVYEFRVMRKNGEAVPIEIRVNVFEWEGRPATLNFLIDISERKKIQQTLRDSENTYRTIFENTGTAMAIIEEDTTLSLANDEMEIVAGFTKEELTNGTFSWTSLIDKHDLEKMQNYHKLRRVNASPVPKNYEYQFTTKSGQVKSAFATITLIPDTKKTLASIIDITDRKKVEEDLRKSEERLRELFRNSLDIISVFDKDGIFQHLSPSLTGLTGHQERDLLGKSCFEFIHPDDIKLTIDAFSEVAELKNNHVATEFRFRKADGSWIYLEALGSNCLDNPAINGIIISARDITYRKRIEAQLFHSQKMEAIGTLAGGIAHDFNNLLMGIQGYISLMLLHKKSDDPDFTKMNNIQSLVQSGADLTAKLLGFARGGQYELKPTDLNELISKTVNIFGRTKKEIMIHQKYEKNLWTVEVDRIQIEQVLINLYVNAWQAMSAEGGDIYVETENTIISETDAHPLNIKAGDYARISITDTGSGMDEKTKQRIFEPFFTTKEKGRGVGLGLASVYGIIKEHGGVIDVTSELGHGTIFCIYLPASTKAIVKETVIPKIIVTGTETILLVDDEEAILDVCKEIISTMGYKVLCTNNGKDAVKLLTEHKNTVDLVILDMIMPGMSGSETYDALKSIDPQVRVMLSTGYSLSDQAQKIMEKGCQAFIQKPFRIDDLSQKIREVLDKKSQT